MIGNAEAFFIPDTPAQPIAMRESGQGYWMEDDKSGTLRAEGKNRPSRPSHVIAQPIAFSGQMSNPQTDVDMTQTLQAKNPMAVAHPIATHDIAGTMLSRKTSGGFSNSIDHAAAGYMAIQQMSVVAPTLTAANDPSRSPQSSEVTQQVYSVLQASMAVRRLTPVECERLQGFPDNYTDIKHKGKATPDGLRYKALGNSMAVPVMHWIGKRIQEVNSVLLEFKA
jgi:DNA (cytosine-5)-methyltransferase 1